jgi:hypothetical protein
MGKGGYPGGSTAFSLGSDWTSGHDAPPVTLPSEAE